VNTFGLTDIRLRCGGAHDSGFGHEHGRAALKYFTEEKSVWINVA